MAFREALFSYEAAPPFLRRSLKRLWYTACGKAQPFRKEGGKPRFVRPEKFLPRQAQLGGSTGWR